ncbi:MAG: hypothetical protein OHK0029_12110 [Armatimonadaceae bacterium]
MKRIASRWLAGAFLAATLSAFSSAVPAFAQEAPTADDILRAASKAYKAARTCSMDYTVTLVERGKTTRLAGTLTYALPNKARLQMKVESENPLGELSLGPLEAHLRKQDKVPAPLEITSVSDGKATYTLSTPNFGGFMKGTAAEGFQNINSVIGTGDSPLSILAGFLRADDPMEGVPPGAFQAAPDAENNGTAVKVVTANLPAQAGDETTLRMELGRDDKLFRQIKITTLEEGKPAGMTIDFSNVRVNTELEPTTFAFSAPEGAKPLSSEEAPAGDGEQAVEAMYDPRLKVGSAPLPFLAKDFKGNVVTPEKFKGKVLLLDFWATWCGPCIAELPNVRKVYEKYHGKGLEIVSISLDDSRKEVDAFLQKQAMPWTHVWDDQTQSPAIAQKYGVQAIPLMIVIGRNGKISAVNPRGPELEKAVQAAVNAK